MAVRDKVKVQKIEEYLAEQLKRNKSLRQLISNYNLRGLFVEKFKEMFGEMSPEEMEQFILADGNAYKLGKWGHDQSKKRSPMYSRGFDANGKKRIIINDGRY